MESPEKYFFDLDGLNNGRHDDILDISVHKKKQVISLDDEEILFNEEEHLKKKKHFSPNIRDELLDSHSSEEEINGIDLDKKKYDLNRTSKINNNLEKKKKPTQKYRDDIVHILKYAEESNPNSLVLELCQNLKWAPPDFDSVEVIENNFNVYKTQCKLKNFVGEGVGITKKISRSN
jgi:hypothetical protein